MHDMNSNHHVARQAIERVQRVGPALYAKETIQSFILSHRTLAQNASADIIQRWARIRAYTNTVPQYETGMYELVEKAGVAAQRFVKTQTSLIVPPPHESEKCPLNPTELASTFHPDLLVGCSCLLFLLPAQVYARIGFTWGMAVFLAVTVTSVLADAVFCNHIFFDILDRIVATICFVTAVFFNAVHAPNLEWFPSALAFQTLLMLPPLCCLHQARKYPVRSAAWRCIQSLWHILSVVVITGTTDMQFSISLAKQLWDKTEPQSEKTHGESK
jgi:hypothetical protein